MENSPAPPDRFVPETALVVVAGATGQLGGEIIARLLERGARVRALARPATIPAEITRLRATGAEPVVVDYAKPEELTRACQGAVCVVSALSGLREVIVDAQIRLLNAALAARVPRFIPSDFCIDYRPLSPGHNRNLDLRREFNQWLDQAPIQATSILNGMFSNLLTGQAPVLLFGIRRVFYWGPADQPLDFTTLEDTAAFTAAAALDPTAPRYLSIAGEVATIRDLQRIAGQVTGQRFGLLRPGGLKAFDLMIRLTKKFAPAENEVFPAWQGMQYLRDMLSGTAKHKALDNARYPEVRFTSISEVLANRAAG